MKFCKDCKHFFEVDFSGHFLPPPPSVVVSQCRSSLAPVTVDPVYGWKSYSSAKKMREGSCGTAAAWFEVKPANPAKRSWFARLIKA